MSTLSIEEQCPCGRALHYRDPNARRAVEALIAQLGPNTTVVTPWGSWRVPRHYIALHGLPARDLPTLALVYGWPAAEGEG